MPLLTECYMLFLTELITLLEFFKELFLLGQSFFSCMAASRLAAKAQPRTAMPI